MACGRSAQLRFLSTTMSSFTIGSSDFTGYTRTYTKDTERHRTAGPRRGMCKLALNRPYFLVRLHAINEDMKEVIIMRCAGSASGHRWPTFRYASVECFTDTRKRVLRLGTRCASATVTEAI